MSIGDVTYQLEEPFLVIATQNPLEQQGTYPLPEAQQDRFMLKLKIQYPTREEEQKIIQQYSLSQAPPSGISAVITKEDIFTIRSCVDSIYLDEKSKTMCWILSLKLGSLHHTLPAELHPGRQST